MRTLQVLIIVLAVFCSNSTTATENPKSSDTRESADNPAYQLTVEEKVWLKDHPEIRVGGPMAFPPFHFYDADGEPTGIGPDVLLMLLSRNGIRIHYAEKLPWLDVLKKAENREIDLIACTADTPDRRQFLLLSAPYLSYPMVIISRRDASFVGGLEDLHGKAVAIVEKISTYEWLQRDRIRLVPHFVGSPIEALQAVSTGKADACIENLAAATYLIEKHGLANLKIAAPTAWGNYQLFFGVRKDWPELVSILNKTLASLPPEMQSSVRNRWISVRYEYGLRPVDVLKWIASVLIPAGLILLLFGIQNRRLKTQITVRKTVEREREQYIEKLQSATLEIKILRGFLPICVSCKRIRDDSGNWNQIEAYIRAHSEAEFSHGICADCAKKLYPDLEIPGTKRISP